MQNVQTDSGLDFDSNASPNQQMQELVLPILEETLQQIQSSAAEQPTPELAVARPAEKDHLRYRALLPYLIVTRCSHMGRTAAGFPGAS